MRQVNALVTEIREYCAAHADATQAAKYARYFREGYDAWGLLSDKHPFFNEKQQEWLERYRALGLPGFLQAGEMLFASGKYEEGALAIRFAAHYLDQFGARSLDGLARWFKAGIGNWAHTDTLCGLVISPLLETGRISLEALAPWRQSDFKYQRRAVPVGMLSLLKHLKKDAGEAKPRSARWVADVRPLLDCLRPLMMDPERVVQQGLGWFLREAWKKRPQPVEKFLLEWKDKSPRLIFQYATEKMTAEARTRFRRAKTKSA